jgi:hypothetical protein
MNVPSLAAVLLMLVTAAGPAKAPDRHRSALDVGPDDSALVIGISGLGQLEDELQHFVDYMKLVGLDDPGIAKWNRWLSAASGRQGNAALQLGLKAESSVALYISHAKKVVVAVDVANERNLLKSLKALIAKDAERDGEKTSPRVKTARRTLPGRAREITFSIAGETRLVVRVQSGVAILSTEAKALDGMRLSGGARPDVFNRLSVSHETFTLAFAILPLSAQTNMPSATFLQGPFTLLGGLQGTLELGRGGMRLWSQLEFAEDIEPYLAIAKPSEHGADARKAMEGLLPKEPLGWFRFSFDPKATFNLMRTMSGDAFQEFLQQSNQALGLDFEKDVINTFTGDLMVLCTESLADCVVALGTTQPERAAETFIHLLKQIAQRFDEIHLDTKTLLKTREFTLRESIFYEQAHDKRGKPKKKAERTQRLRLYWGTRKELLLAGLSATETESALQRHSPPAAHGPAFMKGRAFDSNDILAAYQVVVDPSMLLREFLPIARALFPGDDLPGMIGRGIDTYMALSDRLVDGGILIGCEGRTLTLEAQSRALPSQGAPDYSEPWAKAYERAIELRYQGKIRSSNLALLQLAEDAPNTPWAFKARTYALLGAA